MKKIFYLGVMTLMLLGFNHIKAQNYVLNENFDNNNNGWDISNSDEATTKIKNGKYYADISKGIYWLDRLVKVDIDEDKDWVFESSMIKKSGDVSYGLTWGGDNKGSRYNFVISSDKTYMIHKWKDYNVTFNVNSEKSSAINGEGETNKLTIKKTGDKLSFYVNDVYLTQIDYEPLFGKYFGFYANSGEMKIEVDYIRIYYTSGAKITTDKSDKVQSGEVAFEDNFSNNDNDWPVTGGTSLSRKVKNGKYVWEGTSNDLNSNWDFVPIKLDQDRDFMIETSVEKVSGPESGWGFGLIWGSDQNRFTIFGSSGKYSVAGDIYARNPSDYIHTGNGTNKMTIKKIGDKLEFYVNDKFLKKADFTSFTPNQIGIYTYMNDVRLEVDYIKITYISGSNVKQVKSSGNFILNEEFDDNTNGWVQDNTDDIYIKVSGGKMTFENKGKDNAYNTWIPTTMDEESDYTIETTIKKISGIDNNGFGVTFGLKDVNNKIDFTITSNGYYKLLKWTHGEFEDLIPYTESSFIKQGNDETNTLKIVHDGSSIKLYINDNYVNKFHAPSFYGTKIGFVINKNQRIEVKNLKIYK